LGDIETAYKPVMTIENSQRWNTN